MVTKRHYNKGKMTKRKNSSHKNSSSKRKVSRHHKTKKHHKAKRHHKKSFKGGFGPGACPVGFPWKGDNIGSWPGVAGVPGQSNYLELSKVGIPAGPFDPPLSSRLMNGGGLIPQDLVNFGRSIMGSIQNTYYGTQGLERPDSTYPLPTTQPEINKDVQYLRSTSPDIKQIHLDAGKKVASM